MSAIPIPFPIPLPMPTAPARPQAAMVVYPESDGKPMADNTKQFRWITLIKGNLDVLYRDEPNVFVAGDHLWYAVEGFPEIRAAPDVFVAYSRPKGDRGSYLQWIEGGVAPQVVFEVLSPGNTYSEMEDKRDWYEEYGVEEYYVFDPDRPDRVHVYLHDGAIFRPKKKPHGFVSPRMGIRFDLSGPTMRVWLPNGRPFLSMEEIEAQRDAAEQRAADSEKRATAADERAARLASLLGKLRRGEATAEDLGEMDRLTSGA